MSVLTKIFVVALVVLSLLLSAATITFVNSVDDYQRANAALEQKIASQTAAASAAQADAERAKTAASDQLAAKESEIERLRSEAAAAQQAAANLGTQLAAAKSDATLAKASVDKLTAALSASESTKALFAQDLASLRETNARLQSQNGDLNVAFTEATNKYNVTEAARRRLAEQFEEMNTQLDRVSGALRDRGVDPSRLTSGGLAAGAPAINGVIRETRQISGIPHATISVGSQDSVKVNMEFNVLDRTTGKFLGKLTIVAVEPNEAVGRLTGPDVAAVAQGAEVRTQL